MLRLVISTVHDAASVAVLDGIGVRAARHEVIGRGHDSRLPSLITGVLADAQILRPDRVLVDVGPGSFTGIRVGIAMARGLGYGWGVGVDGYCGDRVAALRYFEDHNSPRVLVLLDARRGEVFARIHGRDGPESELSALDPAEASRLGASVGATAGNAPILPIPDVLQAADARLLTAKDLLPAAPIYVRAPDVKLP